MRVVEAWAAPSTLGSTLSTAEHLEFIEPRFSFMAAVFPAPWLFFHRHILFGFVMLAVQVALSLLLPLLGVGGIVLNLAVFFLFGFEAASLRRLDMERRGYRFFGVFEGISRDAAELRAFEHLLADAERSRPALAARAGVPASAIIGWGEGFGATR
ncbi:MAG: DUF2628 domain-containing protein [Hyphomicrobiaceae bacterium]|nr:DUF2628 domain-containing protein [Hyphomicrobiaceae bacterium]